jgi:hypothetical protein
MLLICHQRLTSEPLVTDESPECHYFATHGTLPFTVLEMTLPTGLAFVSFLHFDPILFIIRPYFLSSSGKVPIGYSW